MDQANLLERTRQLNERFRLVMEEMRSTIVDFEEDHRGIKEMVFRAAIGPNPHPIALYRIGRYRAPIGGDWVGLWIDLRGWQYLVNYHEGCVAGGFRMQIAEAVKAATPEIPIRHCLEKFAEVLREGADHGLFNAIKLF